MKVGLPDLDAGQDLQVGGLCAASLYALEVAVDVELWRGEDAVGDEVAVVLLEEPGAEWGGVDMLGERDRGQADGDRPGAGGVHRANLPGVPGPLRVHVTVGR